MSKGRQALTEEDIKSSIVIGERIFKGRTNKKLKQKELASLVDVTTDTIRNWEKGRSRPSKPEDFEELSKALELPIPYLMNVDGESQMILESYIYEDMTKQDLLEQLLRTAGYNLMDYQFINPNVVAYLMKRIERSLELLELELNDFVVENVKDAMEDFEILHGKKTSSKNQNENSPKVKMYSTFITDSRVIEVELNRKDDEE